MPNDMDRSYSAWTGRKAAALKRKTLDCGHKQIDEVHFHLWCDRLSCSTECADAPHDCAEFKGKSGIEEEAVPVEAAPREWASPALQATFDAAVASLDAAMAEAPRSGITLADMEAASAAVRARQGVRGRVEPDGPIHPGPGTFLPLGEVYLRSGAEPRAYWPDPSVTFAVDVSADGSGAVAVRDSDGHIHLAEVASPVDAALEPTGDHSSHSLQWVGACPECPPVDAALEEPDPTSALNQHLAEMGAPLHAPGQTLTAEQLGALNNRHRPVPWCVCPPCQDRRALPWWRRMFGGTR